MLFPSKQKLHIGTFCREKDIVVKMMMLSQSFLVSTKILMKTYNRFFEKTSEVEIEMIHTWRRG